MVGVNIPRSLLILAGLVVLAMLAGLSGAWAQDADVGEREMAPPVRARPEAEAASAFAYEVEITGIEDDDLRELLTRTSQLERLADDPPTSRAGLRRRAHTDADRLTGALRSQGFYAGEIEVDIDEQARPVRITLDVTPGPLYRLRRFDVTFLGETPELTPPAGDLDALDVALGMPARGRPVVDAERRILTRLSEQGRPFARRVDRRVVVDHDRRSMSVTLAFDAGPLARFGATDVRGLETVEEDYVRAKIPWAEGDVFDAREIEVLRAALAVTDLFSSIEIDTADAVAADGALPVTVAVTEGPHRSIGVGARYSTSVGPEGRVFWETRNLAGRNEYLRIAATASPLRQGVDLTARRPHPSLDRADFLNASIADQSTDAFDERGIAAEIGQERPLGGKWRGTAALAPEYKRLKDQTGTRRVTLLGLPLSVVRDSSDDPLDPTEGSRFSGTVAPYIGYAETGEPTSFVRLITAGSIYYPLDEQRDFVAAGRLRLGTVLGEATASLPADKRFYAGGGGSVRGYAFQELGPLDALGDPLGGRSLLEVGAELRVRVTDDIGLVPFVEGGNVYDEMYPNLNSDLRWAAGLGVRYFTAIGPIRVDVAVPLNRRSTDDAYQFYISLGQAF